MLIFLYYSIKAIGITFGTVDGEVGERISYYINIYYILRTNQAKSIMFVIYFLILNQNTI